MKTTILILTLGLCLFQSNTALSRTIDDLLDQKEIERGRYVLKTDMLSALVLSMNYGDSYVLSDVDRRILRESDVHMIDLVFTDFPKGQDLSALNRRRIREIEAIRKTLVSDENIRWRIIRQTDCKNEAEAKTLFHGIVVHYKGEQTEEDRIAEYNRLTEFLPEEIASPRDARKLLNDTSVVAVLNRNDKWNSMVVVADLTGSMAPYTQQLVLWFKLKLNDKRVSDLVFFNDGDMKNTREKVIGKTGGIYHEKADGYDKARALALKTITSGGGGDAPENDLESVLYAIRHCPEKSEIILVADNLAPVKDFSLLDQIDRPVHVILCGTQFGINVEYLEIARRTGGSVHTMEKDLFDLIAMNEGEVFMLGREKFMIKEGMIVKVPVVRRS